MLGILSFIMSAKKKPQKLTVKQKLFIKEYVKTNGNATEASMRVYDVKDRRIGAVIGNQNMDKPAIRSKIEEALQIANYEPHVTISNLMGVEEKSKEARPTVADGLKASELLLKLSGAFTNQSKSINLNMNLDSIETSELLQIKSKLDKYFNEK